MGTAGSQDRLRSELAPVRLAVCPEVGFRGVVGGYFKHEPTDILTFPLSEPGAKRLAGELVIGAEMALVHAAERGHDVQAELALYVIHGLLHLCGYDDHDDADLREMRARERHYLAVLGLPDISSNEGQR